MKIRGVAFLIAVLTGMNAVARSQECRLTFAPVSPEITELRNLEAEATQLFGESESENHYIHRLVLRTYRDSSALSALSGNLNDPTKSKIEATLESNLSWRVKYQEAAMVTLKVPRIQLDHAINLFAIIVLQLNSSYREARVSADSTEHDAVIDAVKSLISIDRIDRFKIESRFLKGRFSADGVFTIELIRLGNPSLGHKINSAFLHAIKNLHFLEPQNI